MDDKTRQIVHEVRRMIEKDGMTKKDPYSYLKKYKETYEIMQEIYSHYFKDPK
jgi:hypothetical protein